MDVSTPSKKRLGNLDAIGAYDTPRLAARQNVTATAQKTQIAQRLSASFADLCEIPAHGPPVRRNQQFVHELSAADARFRGAPIRLVDLDPLDQPIRDPAEPSQAAACAATSTRSCSLRSPSRRCASTALIPDFGVVTHHIARNQVVKGVRVSWKRVPAVTDVWWPQAAQCHSLPARAGQAFGSIHPGWRWTGSVLATDRVSSVARKPV
jgi:hypothetical protein